MATTKAQTETLGHVKEAKAVKKHIAEAVKHDKLAMEAGVKAAELLIQVKNDLPHGKYGQWLAENEIPKTTAARLVREHLDPSKREERKAKQAAAERQARARAKSAAEKEAKEKAEAEAMTPEQKQRRAVLAKVGKLDAAGIAALAEWLDAYVAENAAEASEDEAEKKAA